MPTSSPELQIQITTADGNAIYPEHENEHVHIGPHRVSPASPMSRRTPSESGTLYVPSTPQPSNKSLLDVHPARSRSSSVGNVSMLSGDTALPEENSCESSSVSYNETLNGESKSDSIRVKKSTKSINDDDALRPDPGTENDFIVENNCFAFTPGQLNKFLNPKSLPAFKAVGGVQGLEKGLRTDLKSGLSIDEGFLPPVSSMKATETATTTKKYDAVNHKNPSAPAAMGKSHNSESFSDRKRVFRDNRLPIKKGKSLWRLMWEQYNDKILILLTIAAVISLGLGLYETFGVEHKPELVRLSNGKTELIPAPPAVEWIEGVAICVAIVIVVLVGSLNDWQKERQFVKLNAKKEDREVKVIRSGKSMQINVNDVLVGDVLHIEPGDMIPADGIFIQGHNLKCDESSATGESDQMKKTAGDEVYRQIIGDPDRNFQKLDPFMISGSKVIEGVGTYLVTSTGVNSSYGKLMMSLHEEIEPTPLQVKLGKIADAIAYLGGSIALVLFIVLFILFCIGLPQNTGSAAEKGSEFLDILIVAITLIVVAVPEGLPLAVTLALAFATTRMLKENNLVRILRACETMGNATTVCSDKTGTLTQNKMKVVAGTISKNNNFVDGNDQERESTKSPLEAVSSFSESLKDLLLKSIAINSTAFEAQEDGQAIFIGSKTETAMLSFARDFLGMSSVQAEREAVKIVQLFPFDSARKCMGIVVKLPSGVYRLFVKGASEILLTKSTHVVEDGGSEDIGDVELSKRDILDLEDNINSYAERSLRTIGLSYKDYSQWPPIGAKTLEDDSSQANFDDIFHGMVWLGLIGIQDPLRPGVTEAVKRCQGAGVVIRMVTGDNLLTAQAIATQCGIFTEGGIVMEGPKFRLLSESEMDSVLPRLQVLARSSPEDKRILVRRLKQLGETVAVTGDGTNDGPALKTADIGFAMGISGTEVAKEASSIILMDDNFASIVKALMWGRAVNDAVQKFLQFQLTVNITAVVLTFVTAVQSQDRKSVLTAVQLLWVNLIMDTLAALALATDAPTELILKRKPSPKSAPLITLNMWKMIIGQAIFQLIATFVLYFAGRRILPVAYTEKQLRTIVFNTFVWMQIFNQVNNRRLDNRFNIFEGITKNYFFMMVFLLMVGGQVAIIFVGGEAFSIERLNGIQWAICILVAMLSLPWAVLIRCVPDEFVGRMWDASRIEVAFSVLTKLVTRKKSHQAGDNMV